MKCPCCEVGSFVKATLILDAGARWRINFCPYCECIQRIGTSVPDVKDSYKDSYVKMHKYQKKGGDKA